jgi:hypothetical protein
MRQNNATKTMRQKQCDKNNATKTMRQKQCDKNNATKTTRQKWCYGLLGFKAVLS